MSRKPRIVIVGAGFGGLFAAQALKKVDAEIIVVDRHNYHLFQPLLYQVATAALAPSDVAWPIRAILGRHHNCRVVMGEVTGVDRKSRVLHLGDARLDYDYLVLSTGVTHFFFGHEEWARHTLALKDLDDATRLRRQVLLALEQAETCDDEEKREQLLTFVVIGAGPTGVELAGAIAELGRAALARDFRRIRDEPLRVILIEAGDRPLAAFPESLGDYTSTALASLGVEVMCGSPVEDIGFESVTTASGTIHAATIIWAAGVQATPVGQWTDAPTDRAGRIQVEPDLRIPGDERVFVIGDAASVAGDDGRALPGVAPVAKQQGRYVGRWLARHLAEKPLPTAFRYRDYGLLATIGRSRAVADFGRFRMRGWLAWWVWGLAHIYFLIGRRSPVLVAVKWWWEYITYQRGSRLITGARNQDSQ